MPVNTIAMPRSSAAAITSSSRTLPPGWMTAAAPGVGDDVEAVAEREERVGRDDRAREVEPRVRRLRRGDPRRVDAAHLTRADPERHAAAAVDDRVRLDELRDAPREHQVGELERRRRPLRHDAATPTDATLRESPVCTSRPPPTRLKSSCRRRRARGRQRDLEHAHVLLLRRRPRARPRCSRARSAPRRTAPRPPRASRRRRRG